MDSSLIDVSCIRRKTLGCTLTAKGRYLVNVLKENFMIDVSGG